MAATMRDIAERTGTSIAAVSVTLNGAKSKTLGISSQKRELILKVADELGYRRNPNAGALVTGRSHVLGFMLPSLQAYSEHDPFYSLIESGVAAGASLRGYNLMLYSATGVDQGAQAASMVDRRIDGLVLVSPPENSPIYDECDRFGIPVVTILGHRHLGAMTVHSDDYRGGWLATSHLIELGHRRIGHVAGRADVETSAPRLRGFQDALHASHIFDSGLVAEGNFNRKDGYAVTREWMRLPESTRPTAIFAANDLSAHGAIDAIHDAGLRVPKDVSVVGYDDTWYSVIVRPTLTSVHMGVQELGKCAVGMLISQLAGLSVVDPHPVLPVSLAIRESSAPPRSARHTDGNDPTELS